MRKVRVWRASLAFPLPNPWCVEVDDEGQCGGIWCATHAEAMFLAQLLTDPHEYIRAAQERAWHGGKSVGRIQEYFKIPGPTSPYQKENPND